MLIWNKILSVQYGEKLQTCIQTTNDERKQTRLTHIKKKRKEN